MKFENKIVLITGATSGIGEETARLFAAEGAEAIVVGRNAERGGRIVSQIKTTNGKAIFRACDVSDSDAVQQLYDWVAVEYGRLDCLVNCAGIWDPKTLENITDEYWEKTFMTNSASVMYMTRAFYKLLEQSRGNIVNVASIGGLQSHIAGGKQYAYASSKAAEIQFSQLCALNFAPNVRVNCVCPGPTDTPIFTNKDYSRFYNSIPMHRVGKPDDVAKGILFLASEDASYITGNILNVDGGASLF